MASVGKSASSGLVLPEKKRAVRVYRSLGSLAGCRRGGAAHFHSYHYGTEQLVASHSQPNAGDLRRVAAKQWLDPRLSTRAADIAAVLAPFPSDLMESDDVSPLVNKPEFDSAGLHRSDLRCAVTACLAGPGSGREFFQSSYHVL